MPPPPTGGPGFLSEVTAGDEAGFDGD